MSTVPGVSGAGASPAMTLLTPVLDAELLTLGAIISRPVKPDTPTGCPTPATITRAMMVLLGMQPLFVNAGLVHPPTVPCIDVYGRAGDDPRVRNAVPLAEELYRRGEQIGRFLSTVSDLLVVGESVPGGTTTALCVLRALGYDAQVSSSFIDNPVGSKEKICRQVLARIRDDKVTSPLEIIRYAGDPMMPVVTGISSGYTGSVILAGGTQMLAVSAIIHHMAKQLPFVVTTSYVRDDKSANIRKLGRDIGLRIFYVDPGFDNIGHPGLARYCMGEVKEGMGAGGAMCLASLCGKSPKLIRQTILDTVNAYR